jgi:hypothetical protein
MKEEREEKEKSMGGKSHGNRHAMGKKIKGFGSKVGRSMGKSNKMEGPTK